MAASVLLEVVKWCTVILMKDVGTCNRIFFIGILALCISPLVSPAVLAADTQLQVLVGDTCPNIPGNQPTMPSGMQHDASGNCFTPAPPPPPDACPNLAGQQNTIPEGYYRNRNGNCVPQTRPPQDVCPNIDGMQSSVPYGMRTAASGDCIWPPNDICTNIPGPQGSMPTGMEYDSSGNCYTPIAPTKGTPEKPDTTSKSSPLLAVPYYLIGALVLVALLLLLQMLRESWLSQKTIVLFKRKKHIAEEKDSFIAVTAHYLRTTLASMLASLTALVSRKELAEDEVAPLINAAQALQADIDNVFTPEPSFEQGSADVPKASEIHVSTLSSPLFWIPTALTALGLVATNLLLTRLTFHDNAIWIQLIAFLTASLLLFFTLRVRHIRHLKRQRTEKLIEGQEAIDAARNTFIENSTAALGKGLQRIDLHRRLIAEAPSSRLFHEGYSGLVGIFEKLSLLRMVKTGARQTTKFDIRDAVNSCLLRYQIAMDAKKLSLTDTVGHYQLTQNRRLFDFVLSSVFDNAIRYNYVGGSIIITTTQVAHQLEISITNNGGIPPEKRSALFQPFSHETPTNARNGDIGLSLFLDKIIMEHLGGSIAISSTPNNVTTVTIRI